MQNALVGAENPITHAVPKSLPTTWGAGMGSLHEKGQVTCTPMEMLSAKMYRVALKQSITS